MFAGRTSTLTTPRNVKVALLPLSPMNSLTRGDHHSIWCLVDWIMILTDDLNDYDGYYLNGF
jgi:hypothetical protein